MLPAGSRTVTCALPRFYLSTKTTVSTHWLHGALALASEDQGQRGEQPDER
jgi:hypothetical protein